jgi:DNA topoisomerase-1
MAVPVSSHNAHGLGEPHVCEADDPIAAARSAGLRYVTDASPGIQRKRSGKHFRYIDLDGKPIRDPEVLQRIKSLAIPPAWTNVWICASTKGHIQATGRDAKGRKQYRYHPRWRQVRDATKYEHLIAFGEALPKVRERVSHDLMLRGLPYEKVIATVIRLLDITLIRIGNEEYARDNNTFGLTTMQHEHVDVSGTTIHFHFRGKSGKEHVIDVKDRQLVAIVKRCQELPGQELFQYLDEEKILRTIGSDDVNSYLQEITGQNFTAKDFRTWSGTVIATRDLRERGPASSETQAKGNVVEAIKVAAAELGNTAAVCRKCYIHPGILDAYLDSSLTNFFKLRDEKKPLHPIKGLEEDEEAVLAFLQQLSAS